MMKAEPLPPDASIASTGRGIRYIGNHCYAFSGAFAATADPQTTLEFTTGTGYIVGDFQLNAAVNSTNPASGSATLAIIKFNDETIAIIKSEANVDDLPNNITQKVLIPSLTKVLITIESNDNQAAQFATVTLVGRVYGAVE